MFKAWPGFPAHLLEIAITHGTHGPISLSTLYMYICEYRYNASQVNMSMLFTSHHTPLLYSKTGVYRGIHYVLNFSLNHRLWVLVRTALLGRS